MVFENVVLRRTFVLKREEVTRDRRKLHDVLLNFYSSPNIIRVITSKRMRWVGHVACGGDNKSV
jgi:hypothetical protein